MNAEEEKHVSEEVQDILDREAGLRGEGMDEETWQQIIEEEKMIKGL